ncbi:MarR family winged helix-turn-helix transcriptional regulator [uncultured Williamsia sp.]|uniref:MarR family winged helix-turn-helix transcriptional regulator n=1 Tax=uncultured Williamsia sp. TaxID=259311 RepID=UPI00261C72A6|nr:MarR family winged helix-turn-helix transcriptional regulator [uncultured Williamsia sp.]
MTDTDDAVRLGQMTGPLRRAVLRAVRIAADLPDLPEAQIEVLRVLAAETSLASGELAARLRLARPTTSNLLTTMRRQGLVERERIGEDLRRVVVRPTPHALDLLARYDRASRQVLSTALDSLGADARQAVVAAVHAFEELTTVLDAMSSPVAVERHSAS